MTVCKEKIQYKQIVVVVAEYRHSNTGSGIISLSHTESDLGIHYLSRIQQDCDYQVCKEAHNYARQVSAESRRQRTADIVKIQRKSEISCCPRKDEVYGYGSRKEYYPMRLIYILYRRAKLKT